MGFDDVSNTKTDKPDLSAINFSDKKILKVLGCIAQKKATYITEIKNYTGMKRPEVNAIVYELQDVGVLEKLSPSMTISANDHRLLDRRDDLNDRGITSVEGFKKMNWFALNSNYDWVLKTRGSEDFYVNEYHKPVYREIKKTTLEVVKERLEEKSL